MTEATGLPKHIAVIMDGNGRWAKARAKTRTAGHKAGAKAARELIENCVKHRIEVLTLFAFSSENWQRPDDEVNTLMSLFFSNLVKEMPTFVKYDIQVRVIGDVSKFEQKLLNKIQETEQKTKYHKGLVLVIAASYGGRWDITQAVQQIATQVKAQNIEPDAITEATIAQHLSLADLPEPDLLIRTSGEQRLSNFLLWQLAYSELYFTPVYWPDFNTDELIRALDYYQSRQRRFGLIGE